MSDTFTAWASPKKMKSKNLEYCAIDDCNTKGTIENLEVEIKFGFIQQNPLYFYFCKEHQKKILKYLRTLEITTSDLFPSKISHSMNLPKGKPEDLLPRSNYE